MVGSLDPTPASAPDLPTPYSAPPQAGTVSIAAAPTTPAVDPYADQPLIDHVEWTEAVDGARLLVYPTTAGRQDTFPTAGDRAWQEVLALSPDADTAGMQDQFRCHWEWARVVAPNKTSWNLEPWRPAVGYQETVNALCNPGGPER